MTEFVSSAPFATRSGGPDDGPPAVHLGFAAEPVVELAHLDGPPLYRECLARMRVAEELLLKGGDFVEGLETRGTIGLLDSAIVDLVLDELSDDLHAFLGCNISPRTLAERSAWNGIVRRIAERRWLAPRLTLEITESGPLDEIPNVDLRLAEAQQLGCRIAVDDFGSGYAVKQILHGLKVQWDIVKLDRRCVWGAGGTASGQHGLRSLVAVANSLAPIVVVEGIETEEHFDAARSSGARYGQGWMFGQPVPERWSLLDRETGGELAAAMLASGAILRPRPNSSGDYLLSRANGLGDRVRALVTRAGNGGSR